MVNQSRLLRRKLIGMILVGSGLLVAAAVAPAQGESDGEPRGPQLKPRFIVTIEGFPAQSIPPTFSAQVSGLDMDVEIDVVEFREGGEREPIRQLPGNVKFSNITLTRAVTPGDELWQWFQREIAGQHDPRDGTIVILNTRGAPVARYRMVRAWPAKWKMSAVEGKDNDVVIESITLVHEGLELE